MSDADNVTYWLGRLASPDPVHRVRALQGIAERPVADPRLLEAAESLLADREICLIQIPWRFGEVRGVALDAVAALRYVLHKFEPVVLEDAFFPMSIDQIGPKARAAGITSELQGHEGVMDTLRQLRARGLLSTLKLTRDPREMGAMIQ